MDGFIGCSHRGETRGGFFLICGECGNAEEMESTGVVGSIAASGSRRGFAARDMTLEITGTCAESKPSGWMRFIGAMACRRTTV